MNVSRRRFFEGFCQRVAETARDRLDRMDPASPRGPRHDKDSGWVEIGSLADYPPGKPRELPGRTAVVRSGPDGIQVIDAGAVRPLRLGAYGRLSYQPSGSWPRGAGLSVLTGERIELSGSDETGGNRHE